MCYTLNNLPNRLEQEEESDLLKRIKKGDISARNKMIEHNLRLVMFRVNYFSKDEKEKEELFSAGSIGLVNAVDAFDPNKGFKFSSFASSCIDNEIKSYFKKNNDFSNLYSLDEPLSADDDEKKVSDAIPYYDENFEKLLDACTVETVYSIISSKSENDKKLIGMYFGLFGYKKNTQTELEEELNISQKGISRRLITLLREIKIECLILENGGYEIRYPFFLDKAMKNKILSFLSKESYERILSKDDYIRLVKDIETDEFRSVCASFKKDEVIAYLFQVGYIMGRVYDIGKIAQFWNISISDLGRNAKNISNFLIGEIRYQKEKIKCISK